MENPTPFANMKAQHEKIHESIVKITELLEEHFKWAQNIEFTYEKGKLYILQSKNAKMGIGSTVKNAVEMAKKGYFDKEEAIMKIPKLQIRSLLTSCLKVRVEESGTDFVASGEAASVSVGIGRLCISLESAKAMMRQGERVLFVCERAIPDFFAVLRLSEGIVAAGGGVTSHMAVLARSLDKPFLIIKDELVIDYKSGVIRIGEQTVKEGEIVTLDSITGGLYRGAKAVTQVKPAAEFDDMLSWADEKRALRVRANISSAEEAEIAMTLGAEGIGLCRTEHIFADININDILTILLSDMEAERRVATEKLIVVQKNFFKRIFTILGDKPITIRLMDPLLNNWLPEIEKTADRLSVSTASLRKKLDKIVEINPLLGYRGCRIAVKYPEITKMQAMAIALAVIETRAEQGFEVKPEIMIPLVGIAEEFQFVRELVEDAISHCAGELGTSIEYTVGTMIEVPRATLIADSIAKNADFFSFGTNDLTQLTFGISKENVDILMNKYKDSGILTENPFEKLDLQGVGSLIEIAAKSAKTVKPKIKLGVCGNQSSDADSIEFYQRLGLNYISCEPAKVPEARIAAAQAKISEKQ